MLFSVTIEIVSMGRRSQKSGDLVKASETAAFFLSTKSKIGVGPSKAGETTATVNTWQLNRQQTSIGEEIKQCDPGLVYFPICAKEPVSES